QAHQRRFEFAERDGGIRILDAQEILEADAIVAVEPAQGVHRREVPDLFAIHVAGSPCPFSAPRSRSRPSRARVLIVPRGSPRRAAISAWVKPSKNASSITVR